MALRAANASIAANMTAFEVAAQLVADGVGTRRRAAPIALIHSHVATEGAAKISEARHAQG